MTSESWRYRQRHRGQPPREYQTEITYIGGEARRSLARDLAGVTAELLAWARDNDTIPIAHDLDEAA